MGQASKQPYKASHIVTTDLLAMRLPQRQSDGNKFLNITQYFCEGSSSLKLCFLSKLFQQNLNIKNFIRFVNDTIYLTLEEETISLTTSAFSRKSTASTFTTLSLKKVYFQCFYILCCITGYKHHSINRKWDVCAMRI